jgi:transcriptional regulator with XRE-family HTH domain
MLSDDCVAGGLIERARAAGGLTQAELARRTGMQSSVLSAYQHGHRQPSVAALARIARAAGLRLELVPATPAPADEHAGAVLSQVLDLAGSMPYRPRPRLEYPPLIQLRP